MDNIVDLHFKYIALAVKELRDKLNYTQEELAEHSNLEMKYIGKIERKEIKDIKLSTLTKVSSGLQCKTSELIAYAEELQRNDNDRFKK